MVLAFPVKSADALAWLQGQWEHEPDLLTSLDPESPVLYFARMNTRREWRDVLNILHLYRPKLVLCRTKCAGIARLFWKAGARVGLVEPDGAARMMANQESIERVVKRLECL